MLSIAFLYFAVHLLSTSACPVDQTQNSVKIALTNRRALPANGTVDPTLLASHLQAVIAKHNRGFEAYLRNTGHEHPLVIEALSSFDRRAVGHLPLTNVSESSAEFWQGSITIGEPPQTFVVQFDTGSSDLLLPGPACTTNCQGHKLYNPLGSSTAADRHRDFSLTPYDDHSDVRGEQYTDTVHVAGLTATNQTLGAASSYSDAFAPSNFPPDGVMGMAYQTISQFNTPPVFQTMVEQLTSLSPIFTFKFASSGSELLLGGVDHDAYTGGFTYTPVSTPGFWQVSLDSVSVGGKPAVRDIPSVLDTGTSFIVGDMNSVRTVYSAIEGSKDASHIIGEGFYTVPCASAPQISLTLGGRAFGIPPESFSLGRVSGSKSGECVGAVIGSNEISFWVIGNRFMQNVYTVFDSGNDRVGFAELK